MIDRHPYRGRITSIADGTGSVVNPHIKDVFLFSSSLDDVFDPLGVVTLHAASGISIDNAAQISEFLSGALPQDARLVIYEVESEYDDTCKN